jgi:hypothetical protein
MASSLRPGKDHNLPDGAAVAMDTSQAGCLNQVDDFGLGVQVKAVFATEEGLEGVEDAEGEASPPGVNRATEAQIVLAVLRRCFEQLR